MSKIGKFSAKTAGAWGLTTDRHAMYATHRPEAYQAIITSSIHPDGDELQWFNEIVPQERPADALVQACGIYAGI